MTDEPKELTYQQLVDKNHKYNVMSQDIAENSKLENEIQEFYKKLKTEIHPITDLTTFMGRSNICDSEAYNIKSSYKVQRLLEIGKEKQDLVKIIEVQTYHDREYGKLPQLDGRSQTYFARESRLLEDQKKITYTKDPTLKFTSEGKEKEFYEKITKKSMAIDIAEKEPTKFNEKRNELAVCVKQERHGYDVDFERNNGTSSTSFGVSQYSRHIPLSEFYIERNVENEELFDVYDDFYSTPYYNKSGYALVKSVSKEDAIKFAKDCAMNVANYISQTIGIAQYYREESPIDI